MSEAADDLIWKEGAAEVRAMKRRNGSLPAKDWFAGLEGAQAKATAAFQIVHNNLRTGRPGNRSDVVEISRHRLIEIRATPPGGNAPHYRALGRRRGNIIWLAMGFTKQTNQLDRRDIDQADTITDEWLERLGADQQARRREGRRERGRGRGRGRR